MWMSQFNDFVHGDLEQLHALLEEECTLDELRAALQNVVFKLLYLTKQLKSK
jgi:hypothetical protein